MTKLEDVAKEVYDAGKTIHDILEHGEEIGAMLDFGDDDGEEEEGEEDDDGEEGED